MTQVVTKDFRDADTASTMCVLLNTQGARKSMGPGGVHQWHIVFISLMNSIHLLKKLDL